MNNLRLKEFQDLYQVIKSSNPGLNFVILRILVWLEQRYYNRVIEQRIKSDLDRAVKNYHDQMDKVEPRVYEPVYTETSSDNALGVSEMRLSAPWYVSTREE